MRPWLAALVALWLAASSAAPLAASLLSGDGPKMACCKRKLKNCCCRKTHASGPLVKDVPACSQSCGANSSTVSPAVADSAPSFAVVVAVRSEAAQFGFVSHFFRSQEILTRFQRPPPSLI